MTPNPHDARQRDPLFYDPFVMSWDGQRAIDAPGFLARVADIRPQVAPDMFALVRSCGAEEARRRVADAYRKKVGPAFKAAKRDGQKVAFYRRVKEDWVEWWVKDDLLRAMGEA